MNTKLKWKSLIFPVLIPYCIFYCELGGKFGSERYSRSHEKIAITVQRSPFERRSAFTVHGNDVHF